MYLKNIACILLGLLGATKLALTCFWAIKVAFAFEFAFEQICNLKFAFDDCEL